MNKIDFNQNERKTSKLIQAEQPRDVETRRLRWSWFDPAQLRTISSIALWTRGEAIT